MLHDFFERLLRQTEDGFKRAEAAGQPADAEQLRRQLRLVKLLGAESVRLQNELQVPDITPYEIGREDDVPLQDDFEREYIADPGSFKPQKQLSMEAKADFEIFASEVGWDQDPVLVNTLHTRVGINSPEELYRKSLYDIRMTRYIGDQRTEVIFNTLKDFYPQFRMMLMAPTQN